MKLKDSFSKEIKNIIFDFGGVILNINYGLTSEAFRQLGISNFDEMFSKAKQSDLFDNLEKGLISPGEFCDRVRTITAMILSNDQIFDAWNALLLDLPKERIELITALRKKYKTFLLSNTNKIHADAFFKIIDASVGRNNFNNAFDKIYLSHEIKLRKPGREIFELVLRENDLEKEETLFIDDSIQHVEAASCIGIHAYHLKERETIFDLFSWVFSSEYLVFSEDGSN